MTKQFVLCAHCELHAYDRCACGQLVCANHHQFENGALVCPGCSKMEFPVSVLPINKSPKETAEHRGHTITAIRIDCRGWISWVDRENSQMLQNRPYPTADEAIAAARETIDAELDGPVIEEQATEEEPAMQPAA